MDHITATIVPRETCESNVVWIYKTRKYISHFDARKMYFLSFSGDKDKDVPPPDISLWAQANDAPENSDILLTALISAPMVFSKQKISDYMMSPETRDLGVALAICNEHFEELLKVASNDEIILYLENNNLNEDQLSTVNDILLLKAIMNRIIDKKKVIFTILINNFYRIITQGSFSFSDIFNAEFIAKYIEHASLSYKNDFLEYLLINYPHIHPVMETMYCLYWDPFTRSRRFSHWLNVCSKMNELSRCYEKIPHINDTIKRNAEYIKEYNRYIEVYGGRY